jgi:replicative DNA helicase
MTDLVILGTAIANPHLLDNELAGIPQRWWSGEKYYELYRTITALHGEGRPVDLLHIMDANAAVATLAAEATSNQVFPRQIAAYRELLGKGAQRRQLDMLALEVRDMVSDNADPEDVTAMLESTLAGMNSDAGGAGYLPARDFLMPLVGELESRMKRETDLVGITSGFPSLDHITLGLDKGWFVVIGARPSVGKTAIALNMAYAQIKAGHRVGFLSLEMTADKLLERIASSAAHVPHADIRAGNFGTKQLALLNDALGKMVDAPLYFYSRIHPNLNSVSAVARRMVYREHVDVIYIDYLGLIQNHNARQRWEQMLEVSATLKQLAVKLNVPIVAMSQLTRDSQGHRPSLASIRDTGAVEQDADIVAFLHPSDRRPSIGERRAVDLIIAKNRHGQTMDVALDFEGDYMRFKESA